MWWLIIRILVLAIVALCVTLNIRRHGWRKYVINLLIAIDQFANALLGGLPDETISSRCGRGQAHWYWRILGRILNAIDPNHIQDAYQNEVNSSHGVKV